MFTLLSAVTDQYLIYHRETKTMERDNLMHGARSALNQNEEIRAWSENYLKAKTRREKPQMSDEEFEKFWKYHKPEIMHAGAGEAMQAWREGRRPETSD